jgi:4-diphosphocytidyl-2C-methyl-D-erythritol kinase
MTGSGACLFAALETREEAEVIAAIAPQGLKVNVAEGLDKLPPMQEVA